MKFQVRVLASKAGSIGTKYCEARTYTVVVPDRTGVNDAAILQAHRDGLEHVLVTRITAVTNGDN